ncbi:MAG: four helix bundle protein [Patescibacteria group bacterium]
MTEVSKPKIFNLEPRTEAFARAVREFLGTLQKDIGTQEDVRQLIRSSGSIGANYIEANESLGKKDFVMKLRICRKEAKETTYWLNLLNTANPQRLILINEAQELTAIFGSIITKVQ